MKEGTIRVFVVDDHRLFLSGVRSELGRAFAIVGDADPRVGTARRRLASLLF